MNANPVCWFCGKESADPKATVYLYLKADTAYDERYPGSKKPGAISVPSCLNCQAQDKLSERIEKVSFSLPFILIFLGAVIIFWGEKVWSFQALPGVILRGAITAILWGLFSLVFVGRQFENFGNWLTKKLGLPSENRELRAREYPSVAKMLKSNWVISTPSKGLDLRTTPEPQEISIRSTERVDQVKYIFIESEATESTPGALQALEKVVQDIRTKHQNRFAVDIQIKGSLGVAIPNTDITSIETFVRMRQIERGLPLLAFDFEFIRVGDFTFFVTFMKTEVTNDEKVPQTVTQEKPIEEKLKTSPYKPGQKEPEEYAEYVVSLVKQRSENKINQIVVLVGFEDQDIVKDVLDQVSEIDLHTDDVKVGPQFGNRNPLIELRYEDTIDQNLIETDVRALKGWGATDISAVGISIETLKEFQYWYGEGSCPFLLAEKE